MSLEDVRKRARSGDPSAQVELAVRYWNGDGVRRSPHRFWEWLTKAVVVAHPDALEWAASVYEDGLLDGAGRTIVRASYPKAVRLLESAVAQGSRAAAMNLGVLLDVGRGVKQDSARALELYKKALPESAGNIATWYRDRDRNRDAVRWWRWAVQHGDTSALVDLGYCELFGIGTRTTAAAGVAALRRAVRARWIAEWEREEALYLLALASWEGRGRRRSKSNAVKLLTRAAADGDYPEAQEFLSAIRGGVSTEICRCRRGRVGAPGNAHCGRHVGGPRRR